MIKKIINYYRRYVHDVIIAFEAILANKVKAALTGLGIMFGVAAVISMLAIGRGARQEVMDQIKLVGVNNIMITPISMDSKQENPETAGSDLKKETKKFSPGLTLLDAEAIKEVLPTVSSVSPVITQKYYAIQHGRSQLIDLNGVGSEYFGLLNVNLSEGKYFSENQNQSGLPVCIIGSGVREKFFNQSNPIGEYIKCGENWLQVIGVVAKNDIKVKSSNDKRSLGNDLNVFVPIKTMLIRYIDRGKINPNLLEQMVAGGQRFMSGGAQTQTADVVTEKRGQQLDKIIVQVHQPEQLAQTADVIHRLLLRRHRESADFEVTVPELLLKQQQKTNDIFNLVLGAIASISLIVGGIGIMNIMLASVWERIREIGTRQAIGASRKDIVVQFLAESTLISLSGGFLGIALGVLLAYLIQLFADITTIVSVFSVFIAFGVSVAVGIIFGYIPAKRAAEQDPVESLRQ